MPPTTVDKGILRVQKADLVRLPDLFVGCRRAEDCELSAYGAERGGRADWKHTGVVEVVNVDFFDRLDVCRDLVISRGLLVISSGIRFNSPGRSLSPQDHLFSALRV